MRLFDRLKLRHLEIFVEVARQGSVSAAAEALRLTQPSVSRTMRELEEVCGRALLERDGRGIRLSDHGKTFLRHATASLIAAREGVNSLSDLDSPGPPVRLGALPTVSATVVPEAVGAFGAARRRNRLSVITGDNRFLLEELRLGRLDLVIGRLPAPKDMLGLTFEPLYRERVVFVVRPGHPLAGRSNISAADIAGFTLLLPNTGAIIRPYVERLMLEQGFPPPPDVIETVSDSFGHAYLRQSDAVWAISAGVVAADLVDGGLVALPLDTLTTEGSVGLCTRGDRRLSPAAEQFAEILRRMPPPPHLARL